MQLPVTSIVSTGLDFASVEYPCFFPLLLVFSGVIAQIGLCAFRLGKIQEAHNCLMDATWLQRFFDGSHGLLSDFGEKYRTPNS